MKVTLAKKLLFIFALAAFVFSGCKKQDLWLDWKELNQNALADSIAKMKSDPNFKVTDSGIGYKIIRLGNPSDARPNPGSIVYATYKGRLINNSQFDARTKTPLGYLGDQIAGQQEIMQKMHIGDIYKMYIPWNLGYGSSGAGSKIPPYSTLIFTVELTDVR